MQYESNHYQQSFAALRDWATPVDLPIPYQIVICSDRCPPGEQIRRHSGPLVLEIAAVISGEDEGSIGRQYIFIRHHGKLNESG